MGYFNYFHFFFYSGPGAGIQFSRPLEKLEVKKVEKLQVFFTKIVKILWKIGGSDYLNIIKLLELWQNAQNFVIFKGRWCFPSLTHCK